MLKPVRTSAHDGGCASTGYAAAGDQEVAPAVMGPMGPNGPIQLSSSSNDHGDDDHDAADGGM